MPDIYENDKEESYGAIGFAIVFALAVGFLIRIDNAASRVRALFRRSA